MRKSCEGGGGGCWEWLGEGMGGGEGVMLGQAGGERSGARGKAGGGNAAVCSHLSSCHRHPSHCCLDHLNQHWHLVVSAGPNAHIRYTHINLHEGFS